MPDKSLHILGFSHPSAQRLYLLLKNSSFFKRIFLYSSTRDSNNIYDYSFLGMNLSSSDLILSFSPIELGSNIISQALKETTSCPSHIICLSSTSVYSKFFSRSADVLNYLKFPEGELILLDSCLSQLSPNFCVSIIRLSMIYGHKNDGNVHKLIRMIKFFGFLPLVSNGRGLRAPLHYADLSQYLHDYLLAGSSSSKFLNLQGAEIMTYKTMCSSLFAYCNKKERYIHIPLFLINFFLTFFRALSFSKAVSVLSMLSRQDTSLIYPERIHSPFKSSPSTKFPTLD